MRRYTEVILGAYDVSQLVLYDNQSLFYRYSQNMSTAKTFQFALTLLTVTLRGKYIRLLLRVYKEGVCFGGTNGIQLVVSVSKTSTFDT